MDLDEAIRYYSHLADECRRKANIERNDYMDLKDLAAEHGQLADWLNELKVLREKIQKLLEKQEKDGWIPVTERLPEDEYVLISKKPTKVSGSKWSVTIAIRTEDPRSRKIQWRDSGFGIIQDDKVLAWRPLPEAYTEEDNDKS